MSKEAEEFFRQKTIENATRPRMKKFLALVNREAEGKILEDYCKEKQRELLKEAFNKGRDYQYDINPYNGKLKEDSSALSFTKWYNQSIKNK